LERETHMCDYCQNPKNPVNEDNGVVISNPVDGAIIANIHASCRDAWSKSSDISTYDGLKK
jgi:hypothetical protein